MYYIFKSEKNVLYNIYSDLYYKSTLKNNIYSTKVSKKALFMLEKYPNQRYIEFLDIQVQ